MTVFSTTARNDYAGTGITGPFSYSFRVFAASDLRVTRRDTSGVETELEYGTDYTVTGVGNGGGGTVTLSEALASGEALTIRRVLPLVQRTDFLSLNRFLPDQHQAALDRATMVDQQQQDELDRALKLPETADGAPYDLRLPLPTPLTAIGWDGSGLALMNLPLNFLDAIVNTYVAGIGFTPGVTTTLQLSEAPGAQANVMIHFDGVVRAQSTYTVTGKTVTFTAPIPGGTTKVEAQYHRAFDLQIPRGPLFNVQDAPFRAKGDGVTDDHAAIAAAITAARAVGGTVYIPETASNTYRISQPLTLGGPGVAFVPLIGNQNRPTLTFTGASGFAIDCSGSDTTTNLVVGGLIQNLRVVNAVANTSSGGIKCHYTVLLHVENVQIFANGVGIECNETISSLWENVYVTPASGQMLVGIRGFRRNFVFQGGRVYGCVVAAELIGESISFLGTNFEFCDTLLQSGALTTALFSACHFETSQLLLTNATTIPRVAVGGGNWVDNGSPGTGIAGAVVFNNCHIALEGFTQTNLVVLKDQLSFTYELVFNDCLVRHSHLIITDSFTPGVTNPVRSGTAVKLYGRSAGSITCSINNDLFSLLVREEMSLMYHSQLRTNFLEVVSGPADGVAARLASGFSNTGLHLLSNAAGGVDWSIQSSGGLSGYGQGNLTFAVGSGAGTGRAATLTVAGAEGDMGLILLDVFTGQMKRVQRGDGDSGGTGYRMLRITN
jgi:hypothetical protein